ncbi:ABC transporter ATP-binding protein [Defluviitalea phaphyphila]|uniref:ABC transporter ATP-binding protein n=1 Tax=Defluviitalea phaphyphila TaxID=1473580 RepID=UPI00072FB727|nr:ABC transporter ATP-binding protein [Defluviitalea phaphyphila]
MKKIIDLNIQEKVYKSKKSQISILNNFTLEVNAGEKISIVGQSGVGKTTLLNILGLLDVNYKGTYRLFGSLTDDLNASQLAQWRNQKIGFILQESALINSLTIEDNIKLPLLYAKSSENYREKDFENITNALGIKSILKKKPFECSGGEKSRAVFARGIIMKPELILCDEPTASLDIDNSERIMNLLFKMNEDFNTTIITVTHDLEVANRHEKVIHLKRRT